MKNHQDWSIEFPKQRFKGRAFGLFSAISKRSDVSIYSTEKDIAKFENDFGIAYEMMLFAEQDTAENIILRELYEYNAEYTYNYDLFVTGFKEGYTAYKEGFCLNLLLKEIDLPRKITSAYHNKMYFAEGNVFGIEGFGFDGIACFLPAAGMYMINGDYESFKQNDQDKVVAAIYELDDLTKLSLRQIPEAVNTVLDLLCTYKCKKIGFHGIKVFGINDPTAEYYTAEAVFKWIKKHSNDIDSITMVDRYDSYGNHLSKLTSKFT
ncbi:MAG: hypothetical protein J6T60_02370 [Bacteroidales bacterium]|nr:hypothetical protein [Bacteroidales bacterium]